MNNPRLAPIAAVHDAKMALFLSIQRGDHARFSQVLRVMRAGSRPTHRIIDAVNGRVITGKE